MKRNLETFLRGSASLADLQSVRKTSWYIRRLVAGKKLCRSGPDLVIYWNTGAVFYDLTVIHELSMSNRGKKCTQLMNDALQRKSNTYVRTNLIREDSFQCLPVLARRRFAPQYAEFGTLASRRGHAKQETGRTRNEADDSGA